VAEISTATSSYLLCSRPLSAVSFRLSTFYNRTVCPLLILRDQPALKPIPLRKIQPPTELQAESCKLTADSYLLTAASARVTLRPARIRRLASARRIPDPGRLRPRRGRFRGAAALQSPRRRSSR